MDDARAYRQASYDMAYQAGLGDDHSGSHNGYDFTCRHHVHTDRSNNVYPDGKVFYQSGSPGGCFTYGYHTHMGCSWHYTTHVHRSGECHYTPDHYEWVYDDNDDGEYDHGWHRKLIKGGWDCDRSPNSNPQYTCGYPVNTWTANCGKTNARTVEYRDFMFSDFLKASNFDFNSIGTLVYQSSDGDDVLLDMGELHRMAGELDGLRLGYRRRGVDAFLTGCRTRGNSHGISRTEYIYHTHGKHFYDNGKLCCCEEEGVTLDGIRVWYDGGYSLHVHSGISEDGTLSGYADDAVLVQYSDPGGCFAAVRHEHTENCVHEHGDSCIKECTSVKESVFLSEGPIGCPDCGKEALGCFYEVSHECSIADDEWCVVKECSHCGYSDIPADMDIDEFVSKAAGSVTQTHEYYSCSEEDGVYGCGDQPLNVWEINCGKTTSTVERQ